MSMLHIIALCHTSLATFHRLQRDARQQHAQFRRIDRHHRFTIVTSDRFEAARLQSLVPKCEASDFPVQNLDAVAPTINEQKQTAIIRLTLKLAANKSRETIETFPCIRGDGADTTGTNSGR